MNKIYFIITLLLSSNFIAQTESYFDIQRKRLYKEKGDGLLNAIKAIIHEPITKQEFEKLQISEDDFNYEFGNLLEIFKDSKEGNELLEILHEVVLNTNNKLFIIYMLSYLYNDKTILQLKKLSLKLLNKDELLSIISTLDDIGTKDGLVLMAEIRKLVDEKQ